MTKSQVEGDGYTILKKKKRIGEKSQKLDQESRKCKCSKCDRTEYYSPKARKLLRCRVQ